MKHGETKGHVRLCDKHGQHGILYPCPEYGRETLGQIQKMNEGYIANLRSKSWCEKQIADGIPFHVISAFRALAGIGENDLGTQPGPKGSTEC